MPDFYERMAASVDAKPAQDTAPAEAGPVSFYDRMARQGEVDPAEYAFRAKQAGLNVGRSPEEHASILRSQGFAEPAIQQQVAQLKLGQAKQQYEGEVPGGALEQLKRQALPFGDLMDVKGDKSYYEAKKKFESGDSSPGVLDTIARYERLQQIDQKMQEHTGTAVIQALGSLPKLAGEAWAGGKVLSAAGGALGGRAGSILAGTAGTGRAPLLSAANPTLLEAFGSHAARMAVLTPLMPSMYLDEARQRNLEAGRRPDDPEGFPGAMLHGYANMLVLGSLQKNMGGATMLGRAARKGAVGVGEQAVTDVGGGLWDEVAPDILKMKTKYGVLGDLANGDLGNAAHHATIQALTFAAFAGLHDHGSPADAKVKMRDAADFFVKEMDKAAGTGESIDSAAKKAGEKIGEKSAEEIKKDPPKKAARNEPESAAEDAYQEALDAGLPEDEATAHAKRTFDAVTAGKERPILARTPRPEVPAGEPAKPVEATAETPSVAPEARSSPTGKPSEAPEIVAPAKAGEAVSGIEPPKPPEPGDLDTLLSQENIGLTKLEKSVLLARTEQGMEDIARRLGVKRQAIHQTELRARAKLEAAGISLGSLASEGFVKSKAAAMESYAKATSARGVVDAREAAGSQIDPETGKPLTKIAVKKATGAQGEYEDLSRELELVTSKMLGEKIPKAQGEKKDSMEARVRAMTGEEAQTRAKEIGDRIKELSTNPDVRFLKSKTFEGRAEEAIDKTAGLSDQEKVERKQAFHDVLGSMPAEVRAKLSKDMGEIRMFKSGAEAGEGLMKDVLAQEGLSAEKQAKYKAEMADYQSGRQVFGGAVFDGKLYIDGGIKGASFLVGRYGSKTGSSDVRGIYAHELGHKIDKDGVRSNSKNWIAAWLKDIKGSGKGEPPLTKYAMQDASEGFAEFCRLLYGTDHPTDAIARDFPNASQFFKDVGLWKERSGVRQGTKEHIIPDIFDKKNPVGDGHVDTLKKMAGEKMTDDERAFLDAIGKDPRDQTNRLVFADWLEENGREKQAAIVRSEIANPPKFELPKDPNEFGGLFSLNPIEKFGPRLYRIMGAGRAALLLDPTQEPGTSTSDRYTTDKSGLIGGHGAGITTGVTVEMATGSGYGDPMQARLTRGEDWRENYEKGIANVEIYHADESVRSRVISATASPEVAARIEKGNKAPGSYAQHADAISFAEQMKENGWRATKLEDGSIRYESPLRDTLRDQQAQGELVGEPQYLRAPRLSDLTDLIDKARSGARGGTEKAVKTWLKNVVTAHGDLPPEVFEEVLKRDQQIAAHAHDVEQAARDLEKAVGGDWRSVPAEVIDKMNQALQDPGVMKTLAPEVRAPLERMRREIDALSNALIKAGAVSGALELKIGENIGTYLHRSYQVFRDPEWFAKVSPDVVNRFKEWFISEAKKDGTDVAPDELNGIVEKLLKNGTAADNPIAFLSKSKLGSKDVSILTRRKDLPKELRDLWGEVHDPIANYANSVGRMANLLHNHIFLTKVLEIGVRDGWLSKEPKEGLSVEIAPEGSKGMDVLAGWHTTPERKRAFESIYGGDKLPSYMRAYMKALGATKYAKTVLSPIAHLRQIIGNVFFNVAGGDVKMAEGNRVMREMVKGTEEGRKYHRRLIELGIDNQSVLGKEFEAVGNDALGAKDPFNLSTSVVNNGVARWLKKGNDLISKSYRYEDLVTKIYGFENEKAQYKKAHPEWSDAQVEAKAAENVQRRFPTYSRVPGGIKWLRRFPLMGPFVSFASEMIRTTYQTAKLAREELADPATREIGARRAAGLVVSMSAFAALGALTRMMAGITLDEEDAIRRFLPEWNRDGQLLHLGKDKDGKYQVIDLGRTDPHSMLLEPFQAGLSGVRSGTASIYDTLEPVAKPFIGEEIGTRAALDIARNKMEQGKGAGQGMVYNPEDTTTGKAGAILGHIWKGFEPGVVDQVLRTGQAASGVANSKTGKQYSVGEEFLADVAGQRIVSADPKEGLKFQAKTFEERLANADRFLNTAVRQAKMGGLPVQPQQVQPAYEDSERARQDVFDEMFADVRAARVAGLSNGEIAKALKDGGVHPDTIRLIVGETYVPRKLGDALKK